MLTQLPFVGLCAPPPAEGGGGGGSFLFDGTNDYIELGSSPITTYPLTIMAWLKHGTGSGDQTMAAVGQDGANALCRVRRGSTDWAYAQSHGSGFDASAALADILGAGWEFVCGRFTSATSRKVYAGGSSGINTSNIPSSGYNRVTIGARNGSSGKTSFFNGRVAHVAVWDIALSDGDVATLEAGADPQTVQSGNLKFYAPLDDGTATDVITSTALTVSGAVSDADGPTIT